MGYLDLSKSGWISAAEHGQIYRRCDPQRGDLLLTKDGANTGNVALNTLNEQFSLLSSVAMIRFDEARAHPSFFLQYLASPEGQARLKDQVSGNAITRLTLAKIRNFVVPAPPTRVQRQIAEVLNSVDESIRSTERAIAKLGRTSSAMLADLLRAGDGWRRLRLRELLAGAPKNGYSPREAETPTGTLMLGLGCLTPRGFVPRQLKHAPSGDSALRRAILVDGDLLMSRANTRELVGLVGRYKSVGFPCIYPDLMMRLTPTNEMRAAFLELILRSPSVRKQIQAYAVGTSESMVKISAAVVLNLRVAVPCLEEQDRIVATFLRCDAQLNALTQKQEKLQRVKRGLMEDLLTGRVRLPVERT
ncbi:type I restriction enzyme S subunit [Catenuloplanes atrovinosus]|uniref:Type I restriction enzyme S subunit n=1 Tax=Catenuloplanes atrovinosus TaxID=137266 RepID=A0AAE3YXS3_9ACTN|nr:type I restriction enzyme S subunit [Catenuloplanes atrovinosus]